MIHWLELDAMALEIPEVASHPNRHPFSGVLTLLDVPSDSGPKGARGHRVILPSAVAEKALPSLLGMAVNFAASADTHDVRRKVGVITEARIEGGRLLVSGHLFAKDFPDVVREVRARRDEMGMSYEVTNVGIEDEEAEVWVFSKALFTGAAILEKDAAAYKRTSLAATAGKDEGGQAMEKQEIQKTVVDSIKEFFASFGKKPEGAASTDQINAAVTEAVKTAIVPLQTELTALREENKQLKTAQAASSTDARRAQAKAAIEKAQQRGAITPAMLPGIEAQAELAVAASGKLKVKELQADGKTLAEVEKDAVEAFAGYCEKLPQAIPLGDAAGEAQRVHGAKVLEMKFNETRDLKVDEESRQLNAQAEAIAADLRKQDPKMSELDAFKEGLSRARETRSAAAAGGMTAGKA